MKTQTKTKLDEQRAIEGIIEKYVEGGRAGDSAIMRPVFHENAQMSGQGEKGAFSGPIQALYDFIDKHGPATDLDVGIVSITVSDDSAASVVLHAHRWHGSNFTDHFHLLKFDGDWKIVNKTFSHDWQPLSATSEEETIR